MAVTLLGGQSPVYQEVSRVTHSGEPLAERNFSALLPQGRRSPVEFSGEAGFGTFSISVQRGMTRLLCQDTVALHISDSFAMLAVLDGYGPAGEMFSYRVGDALLRMMSGNHTWSILGMESEGILRDAIENGLSDGDRRKKGGTTAILCLIMDNGDYSISSIGDSVGYIHRDERLIKHFDYDTRGWNDAGKPLSESRITPNQYVRLRNILDHSITFSNIDGDWIETEQGHLGKGETLILASDGLTKNLDFRVGAAGTVVDPRGLDDLLALIRAVSCKSKLACALSSEIRNRMIDKSDIFTGGAGIGRRTQDDDLSILAFARLA